MTRPRAATLALAGLLVTVAVCAPVVAPATVAESATLVYEGDELTLRPGANQTVHGETTLSPGSEVTVRLRSTAASSGFLRSVEATVRDDGTFAATFDLRSVAPGEAFAVSVRHEGTELTAADGRVVPCEGDCEAATEADDATASDVSGDELDVASVSEVTRMRTARIAVGLGDADAATVVVGGAAVNYRVSGVVRDRDGDGRVVVLFDTEAAGFDPPTLRYRDAGETRPVESYSESSLDAPLDPADYPVRLYRGTDASSDPADVGHVVVYEVPPAVGTDSATPTTERPTAGETTTAESTDSPTPASPAAATDGALLGVGAVVAGAAVAVAGVVVLLGYVRS